jgi:hypothetical protein
MNPAAATHPASVPAPLGTAARPRDPQIERLTTLRAGPGRTDRPLPPRRPIPPWVLGVNPFGTAEQITAQLATPIVTGAQAPWAKNSSGLIRPEEACRPGAGSAPHSADAPPAAGTAADFRRRDGGAAPC